MEENSKSKKINKKFIVLLIALIGLGICLYVKGGSIVLNNSINQAKKMDNYNQKTLIALSFDEEFLLENNLGNEINTLSILIDDYINKDNGEFYQKYELTNGINDFKGYRYYSETNALIKTPMYHKYVKFDDLEGVNLKYDIVLNSNFMFGRVFAKGVQYKDVKLKTYKDINSEKYLTELNYQAIPESSKDIFNTLIDDFIGNEINRNILKEHYLIKNKIMKEGNNTDGVIKETTSKIDELDSLISNIKKDINVKDLNVKVTIEKFTKLKEIEINIDLEKKGKDGENPVPFKILLNLGIESIENESLFDKKINTESIGVIKYEMMKDNVDYFYNENLEIETIITPVIEERQKDNEGQEETEND